MNLKAQYKDKVPVICTAWHNDIIIRDSDVHKIDLLSSIIKICSLNNNNGLLNE